jgi:hypothetical protein
VVGSVYSRVGLPSLAVRVPGCPALRSPRVASAASNKGASFLLLFVGLAAAGGGFGGRLSSRVDCSGGGLLDVDFVLVPRRLDDAASGVVRRNRSLVSAGASDAGLLRLAVGWRMPWSVLGRWSAVGGSGDAPRCLRREGPDLEVEGKLGAGPRPVCHSDMWAPWVLLLVVHKAGWRWSFFNLGYGGLRLSLSRCSGVGDERRLRSCGAEVPMVFFVILLFFRDLSAICTGLRVFLDRICSPCTYFVLCMSLT